MSSNLKGVLIYGYGFEFNPYKSAYWVEVWIIASQISQWESKLLSILYPVAPPKGSLKLLPFNVSAEYLSVLWRLNGWTVWVSFKVDQLFMLYTLFPKEGSLWFGTLLGTILVESSDFPWGPYVVFNFFRGGLQLKFSPGAS